MREFRTTRRHSSASLARDKYQKQRKWKGSHGTGRQNPPKQSLQPGVTVTSHYHGWIATERNGEKRTDIIMATIVPHLVATEQTYVM
ncbi:hypothetical protein J6590_096112 [Homalodisca vitripennis]|nr:hypothetical protein J6590_096112 [Homalodisca vitripennis]